MVLQCADMLNEGAEQSLAFDSIEELEFTQDHPEVIDVAETFRQRGDFGQAFRTVQENCHKHPEKGALVVGAAWLQFTETVPWLLCSLASNADDNLARHFLIQTAFEELGSRSRGAIHSHLFAKSLDLSSSGQARTRQYLEESGGFRALSVLEKAAQLKGNAQVMGVCLGLELPANENIQTLLVGLGHKSDLLEQLSKSPFFRIHTVVEDEHIRLSVANFLHFCRSENEKLRFKEGFDLGIRFWKEFWGEVVLRLNENE